MDSSVEITQKQARFLALTSQGLTCRYPFGRGLTGVINAVKHLGYAQIDTISVVERAHHHVLWSRIPDYDPGRNSKPSMLDTLLNQADGVFEYWSHAAAYLSMSDYRYSLIRKNRLRTGANIWFRRDDAIIQHVLRRITEGGPLAARDFKHEQTRGQSGWWAWKPAKKALEQLFLDGTLMVTERQGFQKIFDLTERVLPGSIDQTEPSKEEFARWLIVKMLKAHGLATLIEISYWSSGLKSIIAKELQNMKSSGAVLGCRIHGESSEDYYILSETYNNLKTPGYTSEIRIINPFDNAVIQRKRLERIFNFKYLFECYVPEAKRRYGYFCLLLLWRDRFVGVIDCKAHRKSGYLEIKSVHYLDRKPMATFDDRLAEGLERFRRFTLP